MKTKLIAYIKLVRLKDIFSFFPVLVILGFLTTGTQIISDSILATIGLFLVVLTAFAINDIEDAEDDALDPEKVHRNPISAKLISQKEAYLFFWFLSFLAFAILIEINLTLGIFGVFLHLVGFIYSYKPIRLKSKAFVDVLSHCFFLAAAQIIFYGLLPGSRYGIEALCATLGVAFFSIGGDLFNEIRDWEVDRKVGLNNTASKLGLKVTQNLEKSFKYLGIALVVMSVILTILKVI